MSVITHDTGNAVKFAGVRKAIAGGVRLLRHASEIFAEARMQKALIEAELYRGRYRHTSKNDDDLPINLSAPAERAASFVLPAITLAKRLYPVVVIFSILATVVAGTFAIRLAIGLALFHH